MGELVVSISRGRCWDSPEPGADWVCCAVHKSLVGHKQPPGAAVGAGMCCSLRVACRHEQPLLPGGEQEGLTHCALCFPFRRMVLLGKVLPCSLNGGDSCHTQLRSVLKYSQGALRSAWHPHPLTVCLATCSSAEVFTGLSLVELVSICHEFLLSHLRLVPNSSRAWHRPLCKGAQTL